jgi:hypothetical protein
MVNADAIMMCSLIRPEADIADRFDLARISSCICRFSAFTGVCVPKTCATWADAPQHAVGLVSRLAPGGRCRGPGVR